MLQHPCSPPTDAVILRFHELGKGRRQLPGRQLGSQLAILPELDARRLIDDFEQHCAKPLLMLST